MWKAYTNHYLMKQNRLKALEAANYQCQMCGERAIHVHHKDFSIDNHSIDNLMPVCAKCHSKIHMQKKFRWDTDMLRAALMHRGLDPKELASRIGMTQATILGILKTGKTKNSTMKRIAEALGYPIEMFIVFDGFSDIDVENALKENPDNVTVENCYKRLNQAIKERVERLDGPPALLRYWLTKDLREYFNVRSYSLVAEQSLEEALTLINTWEPGKGFRPEPTSKAVSARATALDATGTESSSPIGYPEQSL